MRKFVIIVFVVLLAMIGGLYYWAQDVTAPISEVEEITYQEVVEDEASPVPSITGGDSEQYEFIDPAQLLGVEGGMNNEVDDVSEESGSGLPAQINLAVPFTPQAPFANWDLPYQEACEEASAYMVYLYYQGEPSGLIDASTADTAIWDLVDFQTDYLGIYLDTTAVQTADFIDAYYGLSTTVVENPTVEQIKAELTAGRPVILPAAGQKLGNPFFSGAGPVYHMLVLRGFDGDQFITNDPGTWRGESYLYDIDVIMSAMGDWNDGDPANGAKRVIFVAP